MLARGWLAYPVTSIHSHLPPKSSCINVITRCALSRRRATALFRNPVCKAQRSVPEVRHFPAIGGCHPPSIGLRIVIEKIAPPGAMYHKKTAEERFHMLARGWLAYPVTSMHSQLPPKSGCRKRPRRRHCLRSVFLNEAASPQPILAYLSNIVLPTYHQ